ncbi:MAG: conjugal transfer protein TrbI [Sphingomonadales bacterium]|nr:conjugal transfer protein TrbI [Sphingomonadales bacterium]MBD3775095.1 conjugal transfer protein TrbI [Paracoccaceae bacterium]
MWAFFAVLLVGGIGLFSALNARREAIQAPATALNPVVDTGRIASPPPLALPPGYEWQPAGSASPRPLAPTEQLAPTIQSAPIIRTAPPTYVSPSLPSVQMQPARELGPPLTRAPEVVVQKAENPTASAQGDDRVRAGRFLNPSLTVPQGTVIAAVLETALDSTRPGAARALVQRDVHSFDGSRVLIPRGSRLYGTYAADLSQGQNRALIQWTRLIRPDGVTIALDSPSSDPLGRAGVKGKVDSKFFQRFGGAMLQSILDIGVGVATRKATDGVIVALPGSTQNVQLQQPGQVQPTLKVQQGASVSVFVARDLDFSTVDN